MDGSSSNSSRDSSGSSGGSSSSDDNGDATMENLCIDLVDLLFFNSRYPSKLNGLNGLGPIFKLGELNGPVPYIGTLALCTS